MHHILTLIFLFWLPALMFSQPVIPPSAPCGTGFNKGMTINNGSIGFWNVDVTTKDELVVDIAASLQNPDDPNRRFKNGFGVLSANGEFKLAKLVTDRIDNHGYINAYACKKGGMFLLSTANSITANQPLTMQISRYNEDHDEQWKHLIRLEQNGPFGEMAYKLAEDKTGNIYIACLQQYYSQLDARVRILKLTEKGNIIWDKAYKSGTGTLEDLRITNYQDKLFIAVKTWDPVGTLFMRVDTQNGDLDLSNMMLHEGTHPWLAYGGLFHTGEKLLMAGTLINNASNLAATVALDLDGKLLDARHLLLPGTVAQADYKQDHLIMTFSYRSGEYFIRTNINLQHFWQRPLLLSKTFYARSIKFNNDGTSFYLAGLYPDGPIQSNGALLKIPAQGPMGHCVGAEEPIKTANLTLQIKQWPMPEMQSTSTILEDQPFTFEPINLITKSFDCFSSKGCDTLLLFGETRVCDPSLTYTYTWQAGINCNQKPFFYFDPEKIRLVEQTAQEVKFQFLQTGSHILKASLRDSCNAYTDSLVIQVSNAAPAFQPWRDASLCEGDTLQLVAHPGFEQYTWNDGLTTTNRSINTPGLYYVDMRSACGQLYTDSINITTRVPPVLRTFHDTAVCKGQTAMIQAGTGFTHYEWQGPANQQVTGASLILDESAEGMWTINANINGGCKQIDSLLFEVKIPASFSLGNDTAFCRGDSLLLQAPPWLSDVRWQSGSQVQFFKATTEGNYYASGLDTNGCRIADSMRILQVLGLPEVDLGQPGPRCATNDTRLDAGEHSAYLWHNNTTGRYFPVTGVGTYWVTVKNEFGCMAIDTITITEWRDSPAGFLNDTLSFCRYQTAQITTTLPYATYLWNTGATTGSISVNRPGWYTLQVTDSGGCVGSDSILVSERTCLEGLHIPNAFTPNGDGKNDAFTAITNTPIISYELIVYSRFGDILFKSLSPATAWDGNFKGQPLPSGSYVWMCRYQLINEESKVLKGNVMLLR